VTVKICPAIVIVPFRPGPVVAAAVNCTSPFPLPLAPEVIVSHGTWLAAVQLHPGPAVTATFAGDAAEGSAAEVGAIVYAHPSDWMTLTFCPAIVIVALREGVADGGTSNETVPFPCPLGVRIWIHSASAATVHEHI
jgi:hypothetical protein